jgi:hypothetical protein
LLGALALAGCDGDDTFPPLPEDAGGSTDGPATDGTLASDGSSSPDASDASPTSDGASPDATTPDAADAADAGPSALVRIAWFDDPAYTPALGASRFDVCLAPAGTTSWTGPLLTAAGGAGLALGDVSAYLSVPVGQYDVRIVPIDADASAPTCAQLGAPTFDAGPDAAADAGGAVAPVTDFGNLPDMSNGRAVTLVFTPPFTSTAPGSIADLVPLLDETSTDAGMVGLRFANVSGNATSGGIDYGLGGGVTFLPLFAGVTSVDHLDPGADTNGYRQIAPFSGLDTSIQQNGSDLGVSNGFDAVAGSRISAFALLVAQPGGGVAAGLVACADGVPNVNDPLLGACNPVSVVPPGTISGVATRFADFIADPGFMAVDVCVKYDFETSWTGVPLLGPGSPGLVAGEATKRFPVHSGALFDVRLVAAGSTTCATAVTPDVTYFPPSTSSELATVAITGWEAPPEDAGVTLPAAGSDANAGGGLSSLFVSAVTFEDLACHETAPVVRVAHMAGRDAVPLTATYDVDGGSGWAFADVPYGGFLTGVPHDGCGYLAVGSEGSAGVVEVAGDRWTYAPTATSTSSLYLYSTGGQVGVLACDDSDPSAAACAPLVAAP